jgi:hypothetical protein
MKEHIARIETRIKELEKITDALSTNTTTQELLRIIHNPGWTTLPEAQLVQALTEATIANAKQAITLREELLRCAKLIGTPNPVSVN